MSNELHPHAVEGTTNKPNNATKLYIISLFCQSNYYVMMIGRWINWYEIYPKLLSMDGTTSSTTLLMTYITLDSFKQGTQKKKSQNYIVHFTTTTPTKLFSKTTTK
jgi:hypothetical protein